MFPPHPINLRDLGLTLSTPKSRDTCRTKVGTSSTLPPPSLKLSRLIVRLRSVLGLLQRNSSASPKTQAMQDGKTCSSAWGNPRLLPAMISALYHRLTSPSRPNWCPLCKRRHIRRIWPLVRYL